MISRIVKGVGARFGVNISRVSPTSNPDLQLLLGLRQHGVDVVLDVGANTGQFAEGILKRGFAGRVVSFEPLSAAHAALCKTASSRANWTVAQRSALGSKEGEVLINVSANSVSSSILPMLDLHKQAAQGSDYVGTETVPVITLDAAAARHVEHNENVFVKIDTQGFEWEVIEGGAETLARATGVLCEMSLTPLYKNQKLMPDLLARLAALGLDLWAVQPGFADPRTGRTLQVDGVFFRPGVTESVVKAN